MLCQFHDEIKIHRWFIESLAFQISFLHVDLSFCKPAVAWRIFCRHLNNSKMSLVEYRISISGGFSIKEEWHAHECGAQSVPSNEWYLPSLAARNMSSCWFSLLSPSVMSFQACCHTVCSISGLSGASLSSLSMSTQEVTPEPLKTYDFLAGILR